MVSKAATKAREGRPDGAPPMPPKVSRRERDRPPGAVHALRLGVEPPRAETHARSVADAPWSTGSARRGSSRSPTDKPAKQRRRRSASLTRWRGASRAQPRSCSLRRCGKAPSELIRNLRGRLTDAGERLIVDNTFTIELGNGSRALALPGADDASIRGLSIDGDLVVDEAARVSDALYEAATPMLIRHAATARLILLSTAWARQGFFYRIWTEGDPRDWVKIEARVDECRHISEADLDRERRSMPPAVFAREYENVFDSLEARFFDADAIAAAFGAVSGPTPPIPTAIPIPIISRAPAFGGELSHELHPTDPVDLEQDSPHRASSSASMSACTPTIARSFWPASGRRRPHAIGVVDVKQFPLGTPFEDVADEVATRCSRQSGDGRGRCDEQQRLCRRAGGPPAPAGGQPSDRRRHNRRPVARRPADADADRDRRPEERRPAMDAQQVRACRDDRRRAGQQLAAHRPRWATGKSCRTNSRRWSAPCGRAARRPIPRRRASTMISSWR